MGPKQCHVCNEAQSKYKCPACLAPYCSLGCFKRHKEIPCAKPVSAEEKSLGSQSAPMEEKPSADPESHLERPLIVDKPDEVLQRLQLESIASSNEIRNALKDEGLQKLLCTIDGSPDPEYELEKAMGEEAFRIFTDKILSSISP